MKNYRSFNDENKWLAERENFYTSSEINRLMADVERPMTTEELEEYKKNEPKGRKKNIVDKSILSDGAVTYILEKVSAKLDVPKYVFTNFEMEWGRTNERDAALTLCESLELEPNSNDVVYAGSNEYILFDDGIIAGTPDMIFPNLKAIAEIKCPNSQNHLYNKLYLTPDNFQSEYPVYYDQMQTNMYLCDADKCFFLSYDPRFKDVNVSIHLIEIERNQDRINAIIDKSKLAFELKNQLLNKLKP